ncbi:AmmeMemoRadiSam system radical SAM enzyme [Ferrimonas gelatinilytica]|uniref:AmmeMemoRadiSam system radical SAM enzyme n=1 Tax=Ferrimonas gelatinilytica TaxID=1255257 RepID=A0ABP9S1M7_9GAMM
MLSFGTAGCNLACKFCQNWDISKSREMATLASTASPETLAKTAERLGCRSIAFTYNDPVIFYEYALDVAAACRQRGIHSVAVTAGYINPEPRPAFFSAMDAANVDLKGFTQEFYHKVCGGDLAPVLDTLLYLKQEARCWFEITTLLIPGLNDGQGEIEQMCGWILEHLGPDVPLHFTAYHPDFKMQTPGPTPAETLSRARSQAMALGLRYVYTGNVHDGEGGSTWCHGCGCCLIERDWYRLGRWRLSLDAEGRGRCPQCAATIPGHFEARPGTWGPKRLPVTLFDAAG